MAAEQAKPERKLKLDRETEGVEVGRRVPLPRGAGPPYTVFVNGVRQQLGSDYDVRPGEIVFKRPIVKEGKVGRMRWLAMLLGLFGTYRRHEVVDVEYHRGGKIALASDLEVLSEESGGGGEASGESPGGGASSRRAG